MTTKRPQIWFTRSLKRMGKGNLTVFTEFHRDRPATPVRTLFTYNSLESVLGIRQSLLNNRYNKCNMAAVSELIPNEYTRPLRGFPMELLETVIEMAKTGSGEFEGEARTRSAMRYRSLGDDTVQVDGRVYLTVASMQAFYGRSQATVYKCMRSSGLSEHFVNLPSRRATGRPPKGLPESFREAARLAIEENFTEYELRSRGLLPDHPMPNHIPYDVLKAEAFMHGYALVPLDRDTAPAVNTVNPTDAAPTPEDTAMGTLAQEMKEMMARSREHMAQQAAPKSEPDSVIIDNYVMSHEEMPQWLKDMQANSRT